MWTKLEPVFEKLGLEYARQGTIKDSDHYPKGAFFTFWNYDTPEDGFYDNEANSAVWFWQVYFYTSDPAILYSKMDEFIALAKGAGFIAEGRGEDAPSDRNDYVGRTITIKYIETY